MIDLFKSNCYKVSPSEQTISDSIPSLTRYLIEVVKPMCQISKGYHFLKPIFSLFSIRNKVAFITGGGSGIGFTITEIFMRWVTLSGHVILVCFVYIHIIHQQEIHILTLTFCFRGIVSDSNNVIFMRWIKIY